MAGSNHLGAGHVEVGHDQIGHGVAGVDRNGVAASAGAAQQDGSELTASGSKHTYLVIVSGQSAATNHTTSAVTLRRSEGVSPETGALIEAAVRADIDKRNG